MQIYKRKGAKRTKRNEEQQQGNNKFDMSEQCKFTKGKEPNERNETKKVGDDG